MWNICLSKLVFDQGRVLLSCLYRTPVSTLTRPCTSLPAVLKQEGIFCSWAEPGELVGLRTFNNTFFQLNCQDFWRNFQMYFSNPQNPFWKLFAPFKLLWSILRTKIFSFQILQGFKSSSHSFLGLYFLQSNYQPLLIFISIIKCLWS